MFKLMNGCTFVCLLIAFSMTSIAICSDSTIYNPTLRASLPSPSLTAEAHQKLNHLYDLSTSYRETADVARELATRKQLQVVIVEHFPAGHWLKVECSGVIKDLDLILQLDGKRLSQIKKASQSTEAARQAIESSTSMKLSLARELAEESVQILNRELTSDACLLLEAETLLGRACFFQRDYDDAAKYQKNVIHRQEQRFGKDYFPLAYSWAVLADTLLELKKPQEAVDALKRTLALQSLWLHSEHGNRAMVLAVLARAYNETGEFALAEIAARDSLILFGPHSSKYAQFAVAAGVQHARALAGQNRLLEAQASFEYALRTWGNHRADITSDKSQWAAMHWIEDYIHCLEERGAPFSDNSERARAFAKSDPQVSDFRDIRLINYEGAAIEFSKCMQNGNIRGQQEAVEQAIQHLKRLSGRRVFPDQSSWLLWRDTFDRIQQLDETERESIVRAQKLLAQGRSFARNGDWQHSIAPLEESARIISATFSEDNKCLIESLRHLSESYLHSGDLEHAVSTYQKLLNRCRQMNREPENIARCHTLLGLSLLDAQRGDEAKDHLRQGREGLEKHALLLGFSHARAELGEAILHAQNKDHDHSINSAKRGLAILTVCGDPTSYLSARCLLQIAESYLAQEKYWEAAESYERAAAYSGAPMKDEHVRQWAGAWRSLGHDRRAAEVLAKYRHAEK